MTYNPTRSPINRPLGRFFCMCKFLLTSFLMAARVPIQLIDGCVVFKKTGRKVLRDVLALIIKDK